MFVIVCKMQKIKKLKQKIRKKVRTLKFDGSPYNTSQRPKTAVGKGGGGGEGRGTRALLPAPKIAYSSILSTDG